MQLPHVHQHQHFRQQAQVHGYHSPASLHASVVKSMQAGVRLQGPAAAATAMMSECMPALTARGTAMHMHMGMGQSCPCWMDVSGGHQEKDPCRARLL